MTAAVEEVTEVDLGIKEPDAERRKRLRRLPVDDNLRETLLATQLVSTRDIAGNYDVSLQTVGNWATPNMEERRPHPHPRMLPLPDEPLGKVAGRDQWGRQAGRMNEWGLQKGWFYWSPSRGMVRLGAVHRGGPRRKTR